MKNLFKNLVITIVFLIGVTVAITGFRDSNYADIFKGLGFICFGLYFWGTKFIEVEKRSNYLKLASFILAVLSASFVFTGIFLRHYR